MRSHRLWPTLLLSAVIEERILDDEKLRARVALVDEDAAANAIADSWWKPLDPSKAISTQPYITGSLGYHWPRKEGRAFDTLFTIGVPARLALTENQHPSSKWQWK